MGNGLLGTYSFVNGNTGNQTSWSSTELEELGELSKSGERKQAVLSDDLWCASAWAFSLVGEDEVQVGHC